MGKSHSHALLVLISLPNGLDKTRIGVGAGRSIGNAVKRNRAKRILREGARSIANSLNKGNDVVLLARAKLLESQKNDIEAALKQVVKSSGLDRN